MKTCSTRKTCAESTTAQLEAATADLLKGKWLKQVSRTPVLCIALLSLSGIGLSASVAAEPFQGWPLPGAAAGGGHFSATTQITPDNVKDLEIVWTHRSGDFRDGENFIGGLSGEAPLQSSWQATPVLVDEHLYFCTPFNRLLAVHAETGEEKWSYTPEIDREAFPMPRCRGVTQWTDSRVAQSDACHQVIVAPLMDARVVSLDARTGQVCPFGDQQQIDLSKGLGPYETGFYMLNTPPAITGNTLITGGTVADNITTAVPSGVVRAYDLESGKLLWAWEPVVAVAGDAKKDNLEAEANVVIDEGQLYQQGTTNAWSFLSVDAELGLVYVPTGNTSPDYYGGHRRSGPLLEPVVALKIDTGEVAGTRRFTMTSGISMSPLNPHCLKHRSMAATSSLAQTTKQGYVFLLDRETGDRIPG